MNPGGPLATLSAAFNGVVNDDFDWVGLVNIANEALVTPSLKRALAAAGAAHQIPGETAAFFDLVDDANRERNRKLQAMAQAAVAALNAVGIVPTPLKGLAAAVACHPDLSLSPRMMSDIDLLVSPGDSTVALSALRSAGFRPLQTYPEFSPHIIAELWRDGDVGVLDLHQQPAGVLNTAELLADSVPTRISWLGEVRPISPAQQIYLTCLHDLFHDGGFWSGGFDIRHLRDISELINSPAGVDWRRLDELSPSRLVRNAVSSQLIAAHQIVGADVPVARLRSPLGRLHHARFMAQLSHPALYLPLRAVSLMLKACNGREAGRYGHRAHKDGRALGLLGRALRVAKPPSHPNRL